tara:strand:- start:2934 stop:3077 length:144 start_codon:yes stop_codon:yes gene_type:complete
MSLLFLNYVYLYYVKDTKQQVDKQTEIIIKLFFKVITNKKKGIPVFY